MPAAPRFGSWDDGTVAAGGVFPLSGDLDAGLSTSILNFAPGETRPDMAIMPGGTSGQIVVANVSAGSIDIIVDITGWFG